MNALKLIRRSISISADTKLGFIGLGHMGSKMVQNLSKDGRKIVVFDQDPKAVDLVVGGSVEAGTVSSIGKSCSVVFSMLPNDIAVNMVAGALAAERPQQGPGGLLHVSCSTISPETSRTLAALYEAKGNTFIAAPVFARPDGISKRQATWMVAGKEEGRKIASELLATGGNIVDMGDDVGASNVVKLCGNFLIAASIESISESMALAEKHGVDREQVMNILSSSIFDCLIYKGYGQRVSSRDHRPGGFSLELGLKDVSLVQQAARQANVPMPFLSTLYVSSKAKGRANYDWSAIGLSVAEDAGIDVSKDIARNEKDIRDGNTY